MSLQEKYKQLIIASGEEMILLYSELNDNEKEYMRLKGLLNIANMHLDWMDRPQFNVKKDIHAQISLKRQQEKIKKYEIQINKIESKQHLAES